MVENPGRSPDGGGGQSRGLPYSGSKGRRDEPVSEHGLVRFLIISSINMLHDSNFFLGCYHGLEECFTYSEHVYWTSINFFEPSEVKFRLQNDDFLRF